MKQYGMEFRLLNGKNECIDTMETYATAETDEKAIEIAKEYEKEFHFKNSHYDEMRRYEIIRVYEPVKEYMPETGNIKTKRIIYTGTTA